MDTVALARARAANGRLQGLLVRAREFLAGRRNFGPEDLRALAAPVNEMGPLVSEAAGRREGSPELAGELEVYAQNLHSLQSTLDAVRCVLLARCATIEAERAHLSTVSLWAEAWRHTQSGEPR